ncbi:hypothetical protein DCAR_0728479 [Daucus carota subsp. sativus]|uniref:Uncharacterized protein n=1 Tax=Daucus carota subsp. sativus TaxID=79200 RepID=A0A161ZKN3_DAUCS|nr:hypothetical protein DCAR_0728479 [Daucus carota subsp. sativus]
MAMANSKATAFSTCQSFLSILLLSMVISDPPSSSILQEQEARQFNHSLPGPTLPAKPPSSSEFSRTPLSSPSSHRTPPSSSTSPLFLKEQDQTLQALVLTPQIPTDPPLSSSSRCFRPPTHSDKNLLLTNCSNPVLGSNSCPSHQSPAPFLKQIDEEYMIIDEEDASEDPHRPFSYEFVESSNSLLHEIYDEYVLVDGGLASEAQAQEANHVKEALKKYLRKYLPIIRRAGDTFGFEFLVHGVSKICKVGYQLNVYIPFISTYFKEVLEKLPKDVGSGTGPAEAEAIEEIANKLLEMASTIRKNNAQSPAPNQSGT